MNEVGIFTSKNVRLMLHCVVLPQAMLDSLIPSFSRWNVERGAEREPELSEERPFSYNSDDSSNHDCGICTQ